MKFSPELIEPFSPFELLAHQVVEGFITGLHKSPFHGFSVEFAEHRLYNTGESTRHIDWKLYGKTDKLFVKRYEEETNLRCYIVVDSSKSMHFEQKLDFACKAVACLIHIITQQRDAVGLTFFSNHIELQTELKSTVSHQKFLYQSLEQIANNNDRKGVLYTSPSANQTLSAETIPQLLHQLAEQIHKRSLVIIFSDMFDDFSQTETLFSALQHLKFKQNDVILFHTTAKNKELDFDYQNRPHRFIDLETQAELKLNPIDVKEAYIQAIQQFQKELKFRCQQYHIDYINANVDEGYYPILRTFLERRRK
ncbi:MAG: DUF58 domain-containing protein [Bacteroidales bacterium]|jgi:uncharacterized protein (DUF58 family)|nr:DUF58 domain-containing protein [Bacteroidales bacterium]